MLQQKCNRRQHKQSHDRNSDSDSGGAEEVCEQTTECCVNSSQFIMISYILYIYSSYMISYTIYSIV